MITPVLMLLLLTMPYVASRAMGSWHSRPARTAAAAWGAGLLFLFTASGHFLQTEAMEQMLPPWVPARTALVYATGLLEIGVALAFVSAR